MKLCDTCAYTKALPQARYIAHGLCDGCKVTHWCGEWSDEVVKVLSQPDILSQEEKDEIVRQGIKQRLVRKGLLKSTTGLTEAGQAIYEKLTKESK